MTTPPPTARPIKGDEQPWKPKGFEQLAHGAIGCLFEFAAHAHLGGFDPKELELRAKEYSAHADALSAKPSPQPTQQAGTIKQIEAILGKRGHDVVQAAQEAMLDIEELRAALSQAQQRVTDDTKRLDWLAQHPFFRVGWMANLLRNAPPGKTNLREAIDSAMSALPPATQEGGTKK